MIDPAPDGRVGFFVALLVAGCLVGPAISLCEWLWPFVKEFASTPVPNAGQCAVNAARAAYVSFLMRRAARVRRRALVPVSAYERDRAEWCEALCDAAIAWLVKTARYSGITLYEEWVSELSTVPAGSARLRLRHQMLRYRPSAKLLARSRRLCGRLCCEVRAEERKFRKGR